MWIFLSSHCLVSLKSFWYLFSDMVIVIVSSVNDRVKCLLVNASWMEGGVAMIILSFENLMYDCQIILIK